MKVRYLRDLLKACSNPDLPITVIDQHGRELPLHNRHGAILERCGGGAAPEHYVLHVQVPEDVILD
jgi:hypothetical protein